MKYRCVKLIYPNTPSVWVLERKEKDGTWKWEISTMDSDFFREHTRKRKIKLETTIEMTER